MRDGFVFYRSFFECFEGLSKKDKLILFDALCNYALNDIDPELAGVPAAIFKLLKPQVDANNRRYENGCKGGRPKETKPKPSDNQKETKPKPKEQVQEQHQEQVKHQDKHQVQPQPQVSDSCSSSGNCDDEFNIWKKLTPDDIDAIYDKYPESGGFLIEEVYADVKAKKKRVKNGLAYVLGYAKNVGWDDKAEREVI